MTRLADGMTLDGRPNRRNMRPQTGLPPMDVSAEEAVIAAFLLDDKRVLEEMVVDFLHPEDFFREQNGWIYEVCLVLARRGDDVTIPTVAHELNEVGLLDAAGGEPYLVEIAAKYFTSVGVSTHARIVMRDAFYRRLISAAGRIAADAYEGGADAGAVLQRSLDTVQQLRADYEGRMSGGKVSSIAGVRLRGRGNFVA